MYGWVRNDIEFGHGLRVCYNVFYVRSVSVLIYELFVEFTCSFNVHSSLKSCLDLLTSPLCCWDRHQDNTSGSSYFTKTIMTDIWILPCNIDRKRNTYLYSRRLRSTDTLCNSLANTLRQGDIAP